MKRIFWTITLLLLFSLALAACGGEEAAPDENAPAVEVENTSSAPAAAEPTEAPTAVPTAIPSPTAEPSPTATAEQETAVVSFADLNVKSNPEDLNSYRYEMVMTISGTDDNGQPTNQSIAMQMAFTSDPKAASISFVADGVADMADFSSMEMVQIGDTNFMVLPEMGCISLPSEGEDLLENPMTEEFSPETLFGGLENLTLVGNDEINGIPVLHYRFDESAIAEADAEGIQSMQGDVYIAKDGGYLVRMIADMQGDADFMEGFENINDAVMHIEFNLKDLNEPFEIVPPAGCDGQGTGGEPPFPVVEDATDLVNFPGIMGYSTAVSVADVVAFYQDEMAAAGYTYAEGESFITDTAASLTFTGESGTVNVTASENNGVTSVAILSDTGE